MTASGTTPDEDPHPLTILSEYASRASIQRDASHNAKSDDTHWTGMLCRLGRERVMVAVSDVAEVIDVPRLTQVPGTVSWFAGIGSLRGKAIPFSDLGGYLYGRPSAHDSTRRALIVELETDMVGFVVDDLLGMHTVAGPVQATCQYQGDTLPVLHLVDLARQPRFLRVDLASG